MNPRPLGYESNRIVARPFCSISYGDDGPWFFLLFGLFCGRSVVENRPSLEAVLRRYAAFVSANRDAVEANIAAEKVEHIGANFSMRVNL